MTVLLLGGTGAMGVPLMRLLSEDGHEVSVTSRRVRISDSHNVHYILGNARDTAFMRQLLVQHYYDAIVDFMHYYPEELEERMDVLLSHTNHYFFLSSCRVYAPSDERITEESPRLLEWSVDKNYLATREYALSKARCEDILHESGRKNWTIIRPYITYNTERLQLSVFEKEGWLYRALNGRSIVFCRDLASKQTTLTFGDDVARGISIMVSEKTGMGEVVHITGEETITWGEVLDIYCDILEEQTGNRPKVTWVDDSSALSKLIGNTYKTKFDRLSNRSFDNKRAQRICGNNLVFTSIRDGLTKSVCDFLNSDRRFKNVNLVVQAFLDRQSGEYAHRSEFNCLKSYAKYLLYRMTCLYKIKLRNADAAW